MNNVKLNYLPFLLLGSATQARVQISNTSNAQSLQDLAAERCSMPYKAPELFNVEPHCIIDERTDIWVSNQNPNHYTTQLRY